MVKKLKKATKKFLKGGGLDVKSKAKKKHRRKKAPSRRQFQEKGEGAEEEAQEVREEIADEGPLEDVLRRELQAILGGGGRQSMIAGHFNEENVVDDEVQEEEEDEEDDQGDVEDGEDLEEDEIHMGELEALKKKDPEFYKFLEKEEPQLLDFEVVDSAEDDDAELITPKRVLTWAKQLEKGGKAAKRATRDLLDVWEWIAGSHMSPEERAGQEDDEDARRFTLSTDSVFLQLFSCIVSSLTQHWDRVLGRDTYLDKNEEGARAPLPPLCGKWKSLRQKVRRWAVALAAILKDGAREPEGAVHYTMVMLVTRYAIDYLIPFASALRHSLKALLSIWTDPNLPVSDTSGLRVAAFLCLREAALRGPHPALERVCRASYLAYASAASQSGGSAPDTTAWLRSTCAELLALDPSQCYPIMFIAIHQLGLQMRLALQSSGKKVTLGKTKKGRAKWFQRCYNWEYISCLELIVDVLAQFVSPYTPTAQEEGPLDALLFPTVTLLQGMLDIHPVLTWAPLHLKCVRMLVKLSEASKRLMPGPSACTRIAAAIMQQGAVKDKPGQYVDSRVQLRARVLDSGTREKMLTEALHLLEEMAATMGADVAFPEWASPIVATLRRASKHCKQGKWTSASNATVRLLKSNADWVTSMRQEEAVGPQDLTKCWAFSKRFLPNAPIVVHQKRTAKVLQNLDEQKQQLARKQAQSQKRKNPTSKNKRKNKNKRKKKKQQAAAEANTKPLDLSED